MVSWMVYPQVVGVLKDEQKIRISLNDKLLDQGIYHYTVPGHDVVRNKYSLQL